MANLRRRFALLAAILVGAAAAVGCGSPAGLCADTCPVVLCSCSGVSTPTTSCFEAGCRPGPTTCAAMGCVLEGTPGGTGGASTGPSTSSGGYAQGSTTGVGASTSGAGASGAGSSGAGGGSGGTPLPQCVAYADHICSICGGPCTGQAYQDAIDSCDSFYDSCSSNIDCQTNAATCSDAGNCPSC